MILEKIQKNTKILLIIIPIIAFFLWIKIFIFYEGEMKIYEDENFFFQKILNFFKENNILDILYYISFVLLLLQTFFLQKFNSDFSLIKTKTYLPSFFFITLIISCQEKFFISSFFISNLFFLFSLRSLTFQTKEKNLFDNFFSSAFFLSIASLFYPYFIFYFSIIFYTLISFRSFNWREWMVVLLGFFIPYLFVFVYFLFKNDISFIGNHFGYLNNLHFNINIKNISILQILFYFSIIFLILSSIVFTITNLHKSKISERKFFKILIFSIFVSTFISFFTNVNTSIIFIFAVPSSYLISYYFLFFNKNKNWWGNFLFYIYIIFLILLQF
ncbi:MAG: hypothetical protein B6I24_09535 [Bacteroidetes bacterium 4572_128]|nr:MAG: hypothetical protein B6I24_09535 [Bacteroidetes bacterium 4572_128]